MTDENLGERYLGYDGEARISPARAARALSRIHDMSVPQALHVLHFSPAVACPQVARIVQIAAAEAGRRGNHPTDTLLVGNGLVGVGHDVIRLRRQAHGMADWITTKTTELTVEVYPADQRPPDRRPSSADTTGNEHAPGHGSQAPRT